MRRPWRITGSAGHRVPPLLCVAGILRKSHSPPQKQLHDILHNLPRGTLQQGVGWCFKVPYILQMLQMTFSLSLPKAQDCKQASLFVLVIYTLAISCDINNKKNARYLAFFLLYRGILFPVVSMKSLSLSIHLS